MNSNGFVPCKDLSNVSIIAYPTLGTDRTRSLSPTVIFCVQLASDINDICVCILDLSVLSPGPF